MSNELNGFSKSLKRLSKSVECSVLCPVPWFRKWQCHSDTAHKISESSSPAHSPCQAVHCAHFLAFRKLLQFPTHKHPNILCLHKLTSMFLSQIELSVIKVQWLEQSKKISSSFFRWTLAIREGVKHHIWKISNLWVLLIAAGGWKRLYMSRK